MDEVVWGQVFLQVLPFSPVSSIPPVLHTPTFIYHLRYIMLQTDSVVKQKKNRLITGSSRGSLRVGVIFLGDTSSRLTLLTRVFTACLAFFNLLLAVHDIPLKRHWSWQSECIWCWRSAK